ncbi:hypothetical protein Sfum_2700 [Syntrophobacter fumaroxidans MPOB]|uniref:Uncharacterized protein n=1 Tax=Syntrophobacter fumaroxidans (strain DSM 10017 / MPOB) TaxID=335543 RepID=A0LLS6_SYNFM|nr:hypothetical protein Sfum_2700 [Syntrophobacter fumaroxidans MPOB]
MSGRFVVQHAAEFGYAVPVAIVSLDASRKLRRFSVFRMVLARHRVVGACRSLPLRSRICPPPAIVHSIVHRPATSCGFAVFKGSAIQLQPGG